MSPVRYFVLCVGVHAVSLRRVNALTDEEKAAIKTLVLPLATECGKDYGVTEEQIKAAKDAGNVDDLDPCLISCIMKKVGVFDAKGMFDEAKATELTTKFLSAADEKQKALDIIHTCAAVNDQTVGDGEKGCERAKLIVDCYMPFKGTLLIAS